MTSRRLIEWRDYLRTQERNQAAVGKRSKQTTRVERSREVDTPFSQFRQACKKWRKRRKTRVASQGHLLFFLLKGSRARVIPQTLFAVNPSRSSKVSIAGRKENQSEAWEIVTRLSRYLAVNKRESIFHSKLSARGARNRLFLFPLF